MAQAEQAGRLGESSRPVQLGRREMRKVILGASLGTAFEWYDFFAYAFLAVFFSVAFFPRGNPTSALLLSLATFGAGFVVRPLGALVFGRLGDILGRKRTFLITIVLMGLGTAGIGCIPTYAEIGWLAPVLLVGLRLLQGFSLGGEYSGAATYAVEHAEAGRRGRQTSWLQVTPSVGQVVAIGIIAAGKSFLGPESFAEWGWRIPFLLSLPFLVVSIYIRLQLEESPVFLAMKANKKLSSAPIRDALGSAANLRIILPALVLCAAEGVALYTGQLHSFYFLQTVLKVDAGTASVIETVVIAAVIPLTLLVAAASDFVGRKWLMVTGALLAALTTFPIFHGLTYYANPALAGFDAATKITVAGSQCDVPLINFLNTPQSPCQQAVTYLGRQGVNYVIAGPEGTEPVTVTIGATKIAGFKPPAYQAALKSAHFPQDADPAAVNKPMITLFLLILSLYGVMLWAPLSAFLVEQFPARIRYTSVSVTANLGTGWLGGLSPFLILALSSRAGDMYFGLWFPVGVTALAVVIGALFVTDRNGRDIAD
jgi:MFS family permease